MTAVIDCLPVPTQVVVTSTFNGPQYVCGVVTDDHHVSLLHGPSQTDDGRPEWQSMRLQSRTRGPIGSLAITSSGLIIGTAQWEDYAEPQVVVAQLYGRDKELVMLSGRLLATQPRVTQILDNGATTCFCTETQIVVHRGVPATFVLGSMRCVFPFVRVLNPRDFVQDILPPWWCFGSEGDMRGRFATDIALGPPSSGLLVLHFVHWRRLVVVTNACHDDDDVTVCAIYGWHAVEPGGVMKPFKCKSFRSWAAYPADVLPTFVDDMSASEAWAPCVRRSGAVELIHCFLRAHGDDDLELVVQSVDCETGELAVRGTFTIAHGSVVTALAVAARVITNEVSTTALGDEIIPVSISLSNSEGQRRVSIVQVGRVSLRWTWISEIVRFVRGREREEQG